MQITIPCYFMRGVTSRGPFFLASDLPADVAGGKPPVVKHRFYHVPASNTAVGHLIMENN